MPNNTKLPGISYFKHRYSCYLNILDFNSTDAFQTILELENETFELIAGIFCFVFAVFIIIANLAFIFGLLNTNRGLTTVQKLFIYCSCADLLAGFIAMPMLGVSVISGLTCLQQAFMISFVVISVIADGFCMMTISFLRVRSIARPLGASKLGRWQMVTIMISQDILVLFPALYFFFTYIYATTLTQYQVVSFLATGFVAFINTGILICVSATFHFIRQKESFKDELTILDKRRLKNQRKSGNTLLIIAGVMFFSMVLQAPSFIILNISLSESSVLDGSTFIWTKRNADFTCFVSSLNCGFNSVILMARSKKISRYLSRRLTTAVTISSGHRQSHSQSSTTTTTTSTITTESQANTEV